MSVTSFITSLKKTMWKDPGASSDIQRLPQISWLLFLKVYDIRESDWEFFDSSYTSIIPDEFRWRNWAVDHKDGKCRTGEELLQFVNNDLLPGLKNLEITPNTPRRQAIVKQMFEGATNYMKNGTELRKVINIIDAINFEDYTEQHAFNTIYEELLKYMQGTKATGEFYTPRGVTDFVVGRVSPKLGEKIADFACGTGGFLVSALNHLKEQQSGAQDIELYNSSIYGAEWKDLPFQLCLTNLLLHNIESPNLTHGDSLSKNVTDYTENDAVDVVVMNPPYGGSTSEDTLSNFPVAFRTSETAFLFTVLILYRLREGGRAGIVVSDGFMETSAVSEVSIKEKLLTECNLHTVIRLPESVFAPYTNIATNLLFFEKTGKTKETWFYRLDMPEGYKHFSKTKPIQLKHFEPVVEWWNNRKEIEDVRENDDSPLTFKAKKISFEELKENNFSLDYCGFPNEIEVVLPPDELLAEFHKQKAASDAKIENILAEFEAVLRKSE